jgi:hypothetical protein
MMAERIGVEEARRNVTAGEAVLVCGYEDDAKCARIRLEGSIAFRQFQTQAGSLPKDREIIFYCA